MRLPGTARAACAFCLFAFALSSFGFADGDGGSSPSDQSSTASAQPSSASASAQKDGAGYQNVAPGALPPGFREKRENFFARFEIIAFGSLPLTLFYTNRGFEIYHWVESGYLSAYAPWPVSGLQVSSELADTTDSSGNTVKNPEKFYRLGTAVGLSLLVAGVDAVIRFFQDRAEDKAEAERRALMPLPPPPPGAASPSSSGSSSDSAAASSALPSPASSASP